MTDGMTNGRNVRNGLAFRSFLCNFAACMKQGRIETITTRIISTTFMMVALAVFKPFGLDAWQWQAYVHLVALGVIGFLICMMTDIIQISHLLFIEAVGNYVKVNHLRDGQVHTDMLRATMKQMEETLQSYPMIVRCHRAFLVNLGQVEQIVSHSGTTQLLINHCHETLPVSRSNMAQIKTAIKSL